MEAKKIHSEQISWILTIFASVCGVAAFFMIFGTSVVFPKKVLGKAAYSGLQTAFGYTVNGIDLFTGSAGVALAFIFPLFASCVAPIGKGSRIASLFAAAFFVAGAALAFALPSLLCGNYAGSPSLGWGAIACAVCSVCAAVTELVLSFFK